jgi:8-oxo-dGTP pyrophosphatase MutT (NUDIX family)
LVTGHSGAGKSTLARSFGLPIYALDDDPDIHAQLQRQKEYASRNGGRLPSLDNPEYNKAMQRAERRAIGRALALADPHVVEGAYLLNRRPAGLRAHKLHLVDVPQDIVLAQRVERERLKDLAKGRTWSDERAAGVRMRGQQLIDEYEPGVQRWRAASYVTKHRRDAMSKTSAATAEAEWERGGHRHIAGDDPHGTLARYRAAISALPASERKRFAAMWQQRHSATPTSAWARAEQREKALLDQLVNEKRAEVEYRGHTFPGYNQPVRAGEGQHKMMVLAKKGDEVRLVRFGHRGYQHNYSPEAKANYLKRSAGIRDGSGNLTKDDKFSANYWARKHLWPRNQAADGSALRKEAALPLSVTLPLAQAKLRVGQAASRLPGVQQIKPAVQQVGAAVRNPAATAASAATWLHTSPGGQFLQHNADNLTDLAQFITKLSSADSAAGAGENYRHRATLLLRDRQGHLLASTPSARSPGATGFTSVMFPGGGVHEDERFDMPTSEEIIAGARREALEELGIELDNPRHIGSIRSAMDQRFRDRQTAKRGVRVDGLHEHYVLADRGRANKRLLGSAGDVFGGGRHVPVDDILFHMDRDARGISEGAELARQQAEMLRRHVQMQNPYLLKQAGIMPKYGPAQLYTGVKDTLRRGADAYDQAERTLGDKLLLASLKANVDPDFFVRAGKDAVNHMMRAAPGGVPAMLTAAGLSLTDDAKMLLSAQTPRFVQWAQGKVLQSIYAQHGDNAAAAAVAVRKIADGPGMNLKISKPQRDAVLRSFEQRYGHPLPELSELTKVSSAEKPHDAVEVNGKYYRPKVQTFMYDKRGRILASRSQAAGSGLRAYDNYKFPGGGIEPNEDVLEAARKELLEEAGYEPAGSMFEFGKRTPVDWDPSFRAQAAKKGRGAYHGQYEYYVAGPLGKRDTSRFGSEGDAMTGLELVNRNRLRKALTQTANDPNNEYGYFDKQKLVALGELEKQLLARNIVKQRNAAQR